MEEGAEVRRDYPMRRVGLVLAWAAILCAWTVKSGWGFLRPEESWTRQDEWAVLHRMPSEAYWRLDLVVRRDETAAWAVEDMKDYEGGGASRRLRFAVYVGALEGAKAAGERLHNLDAGVAKGEVATTPDLREARRILGLIYEGPDSGTRAGSRGAVAGLPAADAEGLRRSLGWFGRLALVPGAAGSAAALDRVGDPRPSSPEARRRLATFDALAFDLGIVVLAFILPLLLYFRAFASGLGPPLPWHGVLAESAAVFGLVEIAVPRWILPAGRAGFIATYESFKVLGFVLALSWPLVRRVRFRELLAATGWTRGKGVGIEIGIGLACLPLLRLCNDFLWFVLPRGPRHASPTAISIGSGDPWEVLVTAASMVVLAPLAEE